MVRPAGLRLAWITGRGLGTLAGRRAAGLGTPGRRPGGWVR